MQYPDRTFFVFNATDSTGAGHLMRCVRYAHEFSSRNLEVHHFGQVEIEWLKQSSFMNRFKTSSKNLVFNFTNRDIFIVDSYDESLLEMFHEIARKNLVIQVIDSSTILIPDAVYFSLDPYNPESWNHTLNSSNTEWGLRYFPCLPIPNQVKSSQNQNVLVTGGGSDIHDFTTAFYKLIPSLDLKNCHFYLFSKKLTSSDLVKNTTVYPLGENLIQILEKCSYVISSAGTSIWDFLANSRSLAVVKSVENQTTNFEFVNDNSLAVGIGEWRSGQWNFEIEKLTNLLSIPQAYPKIDASKFGLDFMGAERFVDKVLERFNFFG